MTGGAYMKLGACWTGTKILASFLLGKRYYSKQHFDVFFARSIDPWRYRSSAVASRRREIILQTLPRRSYASMLEVGCAEGWVTTHLAQRAERLLAIDISSVAIERARVECRDFAYIEFKEEDVAEGIPRGPFDAIVCAGVLVYVPTVDQEALRDRIVDELAESGDLLLEHQSRDYPGEVPGIVIHEIFARHAELQLLSFQVQDDYCVSLFRKGFG